MPEVKARGILLDIEGTTSSISFVYDVMFPYVRQNVEAFLESSWNETSVRDCLPLLAIDLEKESVEDWLGELSIDQQKSAVAQGVIALMDADVKATGLKQLQGLIWKDGFTSSQMVAHLYDEVAPCIKSWKQSGADVRIYSSGSVQAQLLFFGHTVAGDLLDQFSGHYDTKTGPKRESASYETIAQQFDCPTEAILFVSDVVEELQAANAAGLQTLLSNRPGNKPVPPDHGFEAINGFDEIQLTVA